MRWMFSILCSLFIQFADGMLFESNLEPVLQLSDKMHALSPYNEKLVNCVKDMRGLVEDCILSLENYRDQCKEQSLRSDFTDIVNIFKKEYSEASAIYGDLFASIAEIEKK